MEQALKQRLVGALVITALAAIFVPMFFEDSVDDTRREVNSSALAIPAPPEQLLSEDNPIPQTPQQVLHAPQDEAAASGTEEQQVENTVAPSEAPAATPEDEGSQTQTLQVEEPPAAAQQEAAVPPVAAADIPAAKSKVQARLAPPAQPKPAPAKIVNPQPQAVVQQAAPAQVPASQPKPAAQAPTTAPALQRWVLQLGSFAKKDNADAMVAKLRSQGFNAFGDSIQVAGKGAMFRVRIGPELDKKRAQATQKKLQQSGMNSILLSE